MDIIFRADANPDIGMGHIMRCLSVADAFSSAGCRVAFIIADDTVSELIQNRGYKASVLNSDYRDMDAELSCWPEIAAGFLIIDSYYVTASYLRSLREKMCAAGGKLVYLDDMLSFPYPVDILVDYNAYSELSIYSRLYSGLSVEEPYLILGPAYAPLRSMFRGIEKKGQPKEVENILVSTGGSDRLHLAPAIIRYLLENGGREGGAYHFLLGAMNSDKESLRKMADRDERIILHENVTDMRGLVEGMDLAISAAGSTLYEIAACGVPLITYSLADNQVPGAGAFEKLGLAVNVGDLRDPQSIDRNLLMSGVLDGSAVDRIMEAAVKLSIDYEHRCEMGSRMQEMLDGFGADRMVQKILNMV